MSIITKIYREFQVRKSYLIVALLLRAKDNRSHSQYLNLRDNLTGITSSNKAHYPRSDNVDNITSSIINFTGTGINHNMSRNIHQEQVDSERVTVDDVDVNDIPANQEITQGKFRPLSYPVESLDTNLLPQQNRFNATISGQSIFYKLPVASNVLNGDLSFDYNLKGSHTITSISSLQRELVIGVISDCRNIQRRQDIRKTWYLKRYAKVDGFRASEMGIVAEVFFIIGNHRECNNLADRERPYFERDIIWVELPEEYNDGFNNSTGRYSILPFKTQLWFYIISHHFKRDYKWLMKTDDDSYVYINKLVAHLNHLEATSSVQRFLYWGRCFRTNYSRVNRSKTSKFYVSRNVYKESRYPAYCAGAGYVLSKDLINCVAEKLANFLPVMPMEDVATGMLVHKCQNTLPFNYFSYQIQDYVVNGEIRYPSQTRFVYHPVKTRSDFGLLEQGWKVFVQRKFNQTI